MADPLRVGILGCGEQTHGKAWAEILAGPEGERLGMRPAKVWDADAQVARTLAKATGAVAVRAPAAAGEGMDGVLITEVFPDRYLELARPFLERGMRVFFNRPFAGSRADAETIMRLAGQHGAGVYSASALDHTAAAPAAKERLAALGPVRLFTMTGPTDHIAFYLPHAIAALTSVVGTGIAAVRAVSLTPKADQPWLAAEPVVVYAEYADGPRGTIQMIGPGAEWGDFRLQLLGTKGPAEPVIFDVSYTPLLERMAHFFRTGEEPIPRADILRKTAIYHAILASARHGGRLEKV